MGVGVVGLRQRSRKDQLLLLSFCSFHVKREERDGERENDTLLSNSEYIEVSFFTVI